MFQKLVNHNDDINRLVEAGYAVGFDSNYMIIHDIPYLDENKELQWGEIVTKLVDIDGERVTQDDHQIFFAGAVPYNIDGTPVGNLGGGPTQLALSKACQDVVVQRNGPTLYPSIGNWQQACQSHYWIHQGEIRWAEKWSPEKITAGRRREERRRSAYYTKLKHQHIGFLRGFWRWLKELF
ncbi:MAG: hypothetical protein KAH64_03020 [Nitrosomonadaceae bacterium]|nr:hypothetical protein [Alphaproteobacteria bacterium]MCK5714909.1 hypothetical protein [Nitrosomonadaceae bacterium]